MDTDFIQYLSEFEEPYQKLAAIAPALIFVLDKDKIIRYVNRNPPSVDKKFVLGKSVMEFNTGGTEEQKIHAMTQVFEHGEPAFYQSQIIGEDGNEYWFETKANPLKEAGSVNGAILFVTDITHIKNIEIELRASEQKFRDIAENAPSMIMICNQDREITYINRIFKGYDLNAVLNSRFDCYVAKEHHVIVEAALSTVFKEKVNQRFEVLGTGPEGHKRWYANFAGPIHDGEEVKSIIIVANDITEQKEILRKEKEFNSRLESMVKERTEQLEKANEEIKVVLREMHHRVKNNLQIISSLLRIQMSGIEDESVLNELQEAQDRIRSMSMIHETLYQKDLLSDINVKDYLTRLIHDRIAANAIRHEVNFSVEADDVSFDVDTMVPIGLIMNELVTNSLKHAFPTRSNAEITVEVKVSEEGKVRITYADNGVGLMPKPNANNAFVKSLGMELFECFIGQLDGEYKKSSSPDGLVYEIQFDWCR